MAIWFACPLTPLPSNVSTWRLFSRLHSFFPSAVDLVGLVARTVWKRFYLCIICCVTRRRILSLGMGAFQAAAAHSWRVPRVEENMVDKIIDCGRYVDCCQTQQAEWVSFQKRLLAWMRGRKNPNAVNSRETEYKYVYVHGNKWNFTKCQSAQFIHDTVWNIIFKDKIYVFQSIRATPRPVVVLLTCICWTKLQFRYLGLLAWFHINKIDWTGTVSVGWKRLHNLLKW